MSNQCNESSLKKSIYDFTEKELALWLQSYGIAGFRVGQIWQWVYKKRVSSFHAMHDLSIKTRALLQDHFVLTSLTEINTQHSRGTTKSLLKLSDGHLIETVLMEQVYGLSLCVTTQVGCNIGCSFCASGLLHKKRDLTAGEIVEQVMYMQKKLDLESNRKKISHIVVMGIGEPFDNYQNVLRFIQIVNSAKGLSIGARRITISTSGLAPKIRAFADENMQVNLALSLHAANNALRSRIMKINKAMPIELLMESIDYYLHKTHRKVTFEYILLKDINDQESCAFDLANLIVARDLHHLIYVNLIPYNFVEALPQYQRSDPKVVRHFVSILRQQGINVVVRREYGTDIQAACGQLKSIHMPPKLSVKTPIA